MADFDWTGATSSAWTTGSNWSVSGTPQASPPTNADNAIFSGGSSAACTTGAGATCLNMTCTGYTGTLTVSGGTFAVLGNITGASGMTLAGSSAVTCSGGITTVSGMTWTHTGLWTFNATSGTHDINFTGVTLDNALTFNGVGGSWRLMANLTSTGAAKALTLTNGNLDFNDFNVTVGLFNSNNGNTRTWSLGNGTLTAISTSTSTPLNIATTTGLTLNAEGSTIVFSANIGLARTLNIAGTAGDGLTLNNFTFSGTSTGDLNIVSASGKTITFNTITINDAPQEIVTTAGITVEAAQWNISGTSGNANVFTSATPGSTYTFNKVGGGIVEVDYVSLTDCICLPANNWYIGAGGTVGSGTTGAIATAEPDTPLRLGGRKRHLIRSV